jgi:hypothetical protein
MCTKTARFVNKSIFVCTTNWQRELRTFHSSDQQYYRSFVENTSLQQNITTDEIEFSMRSTSIKRVLLEKVTVHSAAQDLITIHTLHCMDP